MSKLSLLILIALFATACASDPKTEQTSLPPDSTSAQVAEPDSVTLELEQTDKELDQMLKEME